MENSSEFLVPFEKLPKSPDVYVGFEQLARDLPAHDWAAICRIMGKSDLYFLMRFVLGSKSAPKFKDGSQFVFDRCREVQASPDGHVDLWSREHYKSTVITFGFTIFQLLNNPELTFAIFSHTRPIAKGFLRNIKQEFEQNKLLPALFPDVCWDEPRKQATKWSEDEGITLKRSGNPKEASVEAWGLVDGQPTSKHYDIKIYDDAVTRESVTTPEQIEKVREAWELSQSLSKEGGKRRYIGTRYHANDLYNTLMERGAAEPRIYPCVELDEKGDPQMDRPVLYGADYIAEQRRNQGPATFASQWLQNPLADSVMGFQREWLRYYSGDPLEMARGMNLYILVDPANEKKKGSDYTAIFVVGVGADRNLYVLDIVRDRLNLRERWRTLNELHRYWEPIEVRYEQYGMQADLSYIEQMMEDENYRFDIIPVRGLQKKPDRIRRLTPLFEDGRIYLPETLEKRNYEGRWDDLVKIFVEQEYANFPVSTHDDMLDSLSRIAEPDLPLRFPARNAPSRRERYRRAKPAEPETLNWMCA